MLQYENYKLANMLNNIKTSSVHYSSSLESTIKDVENIINTINPGHSLMSSQVTAAITILLEKIEELEHRITVMELKNERK